jgi:hypothetical protein
VLEVVDVKRQPVSDMRNSMPGMGVPLELLLQCFHVDDMQIFYVMAQPADYIFHHALVSNNSLFFCWRHDVKATNSFQARLALQL